MARRMEIQLTSKRDDGTWTWRAAGAREPKGTLDGAIVPPTTQVGDVVKVEVEGFLDGITVVSVVPPKAPRSEPERIDLLTPRSEGPLVTTRLARGPRRESGGRRGERGDRGDRGERGGGGGDRGDRGGDRDHRGRRRSDRGDRTERGPRSDRDRDRDRDRGERGDRGDRGDRRERHPAPPPVDAKPKPKRLRPAKVHRSALLEALPAEQRPIAEQLLQGGIPAVRQAIEKQNDELKAAGKSQVAAEPLLEIAERLRNRAQAAAWRDRADAALAQVDDLDLRDLRSVVNAADDGGRDEEARDVAAQLREALTSRLEKEQVAWVDEVAENLRDGRVVRALRLSSRPPKAGSPLPPDLSAQLIAATAAALTSETGSQRWATILDALAFSPIRRRVVPESLPDKLNAELRGTIARLGTRLPEIAHIFDITPEDAPSRPPRQGNQPRRGGKGGGPKADQPEGKSKPRKRRGTDKPKPDAPAAESTAATESPSTEGTEAAAEASPSDDVTAANAAGTEAAAEATTPTPDTATDDTAAAPTEPSEAPEAEAPAAATETTSTDAPTGDTEAAIEASPSDAVTAEATTPAPTDSADEASADTEVAQEESAAEAQATSPDEPTTTVDEASDASDDAGGEPADETSNGTAETNGESTADADSDESVRVDS